MSTITTLRSVGVKFSLRINSLTRSVIIMQHQALSSIILPRPYLTGPGTAGSNRGTSGRPARNRMDDPPVLRKEVFNRREKTFIGMGGLIPRFGVEIFTF